MTEQTPAQNATPVHAYPRTLAQLKPLIVFAVRCSAAATLAYFLSSFVGLSFPVWAAMSALIVSQEHLHETRRSLIGRILGTVLGVSIALAVNFLNSIGAGFGMTLEMAISVGICALIAYGHPSLRVSMWTTPIVLLTTTPGVPIFTTGFYRGSEVILGSLVGGLCHALAARILDQHEPAKAAAQPKHLHGE